MQTHVLDRTILRTVAYFSIFSYPLTSFEIWKWLMVPAGEQPVLYGEIAERLENSSTLKKYIQHHDGFFGFADVAEHSRERGRRLHDAVRKYDRLHRMLKILARLPWIEGIAVCNSLAWQHTREDSDIDLFIVTKPGRTWSARLLVATLLRLFRLRPGEAKRDPLCASFFAAPTAFDFAKIKIADEDPYLAYWSRSLVPLIDRTGWLQRFVGANDWAVESVPHASPVRRAWRFRIPPRAQMRWLPFSEKLARGMQWERFPNEIKDKMNLDTRVIVNDEMLKFHHNDARADIITKLNQKMATFAEV